MDAFSARLQSDCDASLVRPIQYKNAEILKYNEAQHPVNFLENLGPFYRSVGRFGCLITGECMDDPVVDTTSLVCGIDPSTSAPLTRRTQ